MLQQVKAATPEDDKKKKEEKELKGGSVLWKSLDIPHINMCNLIPH